MKILSNILIFLIKIYQKFISANLPQTCRFVPSCSVYTEFSLKKYGLFKGSLMGIKRILRCNPLFKEAYDPVDLQIDKK